VDAVGSAMDGLADEDDSSFGVLVLRQKSKNVAFATGTGEDRESEQEHSRSNNDAEGVYLGVDVAMQVTNKVHSSSEEQGGHNNQEEASVGHASPDVKPKQAFQVELSPLGDDNISKIGSDDVGEMNLATEKWDKLRNLKALYEQGFILEEEFQARRAQLIDLLTGTKSTVGVATASSQQFQQLQQQQQQQQKQVKPKPKHMRRNSRIPRSVVVPRPPPDFSPIPSEKAIKHHFDLESRAWKCEEVTVRLDDTPFARGGLRLVYHLEEVDSDDEGAKENSSRLNEEQVMELRKRQETRHSYVAKIAINPREDPSTYFRDVEMQFHCNHYAKLFNSYDPPRKVEFIKAWILELTERDGQPLCAVERFVAGDYKKHNNNYGHVSDDERYTPQAFSHFTFEASARTMLVVDIQGVGDLYTDPQIHTLNGTDFGKGNLGIRGFDRFLSTHRCNRICKYLKLPPVNPKYHHVDGTIPNLPYMSKSNISRVHFREAHCFEKSPALQKYLTSNNILRKRRGVGNGGAEDLDEYFVRHWATRDEADSFCSIFSSCTLL